MSIKNTGGASSQTWCDRCGVEPGEVVKGYEYAKGEFITFTEEELDALKADRGAVIEIRKFVPVASIKPTMVDTNYFLIPNTKAAHLAEGYGVLYQSLADAKLAGVGAQSFWGKEHPCSVIASKDFEGGVLMMQTLRLHEDLVVPDFSAPIPSTKNRAEAKKIVAAFVAEFEPETDLASTQRARLKEAVTAKLAGKEIEIQKAAPVGGGTPDMMEALREMYEQQVAKKPTRKKVPAKT